MKIYQFLPQDLKLEKNDQRIVYLTHHTCTKVKIPNILFIVFYIDFLH